MQNTVPRFAFTGRRSPLHLDPPEHTAYRRVINRFFTRDKMAALEPRVREHAVALLRPLIEAGEGTSRSTTRRSSRHTCSRRSSICRPAWPG
ncbi:hypothetical protein [Nonomuraea rubra]|uniref:hypothetical protein n=1 Tax=Nonomuraea rubra TaxID=46180 RepID=UPI0033EB2F78